MSDVNAGSGSGPVPRDFATASPPASLVPPTAAAQQPAEESSGRRSRASSHVRYALSIDPGLASTVRPGSASDPAKAAFARSDTEAAWSPGIRRRLTRAATFKTVDDFQGLSLRPGWHRMSPHLAPLAHALPHPLVSLADPPPSLSSRRRTRL